MQQYEANLYGSTPQSVIYAADLFFIGSNSGIYIIKDQNAATQISELSCSHIAKIDNEVLAIATNKPKLSCQLIRVGSGGDLVGGRASIDSVKVINEINDVGRIVALRGESHNLLVIDEDTGPHLFRVNGAETSIVPFERRPDEQSPRYLAGDLDPHNPSVFLLSTDKAITLWDIRDKSTTELFTVDQSFLRNRAIQFNPVDQNIIVAGGDDGALRVFDRRKMMSGPTDTIVAHHLPITSIDCHPIHESLILSGSLDGSVKLRGKVTQLSHKEGSVIGLAWSHNWSFISIGTDRIAYVVKIPVSERATII